jgi:hypothetical protein
VTNQLSRDVFELVDVECHAGHRGEETPRRFTLGDRTFEIADVLDRWLAPDHRYFKVLDMAGDIYILRHQPALDRWDMTMFRQGTRPSQSAG